MNCLEFRNAVGADPGTKMPELTAHAAGCSACRRYRDQLRHMDTVIYRALNINTQAPRALRKRPWIPVWAAAASLIATCALGLLMWAAASRETIAQELVTHVEGELDSLTAIATDVTPDLLKDTLARSSVRLKPGTGSVSYAVTCAIHDRPMAHLVVRTKQGPFTVLLLTEERVASKRQAFEERGFYGVILPAPRGSIAVLGRDRQTEQVADLIFHAVEYLK